MNEDVLNKMNKLLVAKHEVSADEQIELSSMILFKIIELDYYTRELRDYTNHEQKQEINKLLKLTRKVVMRVQKKYLEGVDDDLEDTWYDTQEFLMTTSKHQMNALRKGKTQQFLDAIKFI